MIEMGAADLSPDEQRALLDVARAAIRQQVLSEPASIPGSLTIASSGVFVSLHRGDDLRGCLGVIGGRAPLAQAVAQLAADVCHRDPRFRPVMLEELPELHVEISVLTPLMPVNDPTDIVIGRDGLVVEHDGRRGLLLPQVALEHGWDRDTFLAQTCVKAGLPRDAWQHGAQLYRFEAQVFGTAMMEVAADL